MEVIHCRSDAFVLICVIPFLNKGEAGQGGVYLNPGEVCQALTSRSLGNWRWCCSWVSRQGWLWSSIKFFALNLLNHDFMVLLIDYGS
jgi:hypothetical protein